MLMQMPPQVMMHGRHRFVHIGHHTDYSNIYSSGLLVRVTFHITVVDFQTLELNWVSNSFVQAGCMQHTWKIAGHCSRILLAMGTCVQNLHFFSEPILTIFVLTSMSGIHIHRHQTEKLKKQTNVNS